MKKCCDGDCGGADECWTPRRDGREKMGGRLGAKPKHLDRGEHEQADWQDEGDAPTTRKKPNYRERCEQRNRVRREQRSAEAKVVRCVE